MPLWGSVDNAANSDIAALIQVRLPVNTANQALLYGNVMPSAFVTNVAIGQFGVDVNEQQAMQTTNHAPHAGWVLRTEGTGLRAGRVTYETLVAMGSMTGDGNSGEDTYIPDYRIVVGTQPSSTNGVGNLTLTIAATTVPTGGTLSYKWQRSYAGALSWADIPNTAGVWFNNTAITLTANATVATGNTVRVVVTTTGGNTVYSSNATITTP